MFYEFDCNASSLSYFVNVYFLQVMKENGVKRVVFSSSATVYGIPKFLPITEDHPTGQDCTNPYGKTKYFVEEMLKDVCISDEVSM